MPKTTLCGAGFGFGLRVGGRGIILLIMPGETRLEHFEIGVLAIDEDRAEDALVAIPLLPRHAHLAPRHHPGEVLARDLSERLPFFWRVDPLEADFVLGFGCVENGDRITVCNFHDTADEV